ncbi:hypothetical protein AWRI3579_g646 [Hanseniaspora osmophila]|uniref:Uncharacterized protein n=1 Tax=Hanseniaspora osmophila TaxID=56408 RepID=A0A1E5RNR8_9ASCO|nr:hypothetical protein AWRI3579_g646 [Hanseniaspora osmophila]
MSESIENPNNKTSAYQKDTIINTKNTNNECPFGPLKMLVFTALLVISFIVYYLYFGMILDTVLKTIYPNYNSENIKSWNNPKMSGSTRSLEFSYICLILSSAMHIVCSGKFKTTNKTHLNVTDNNFRNCSNLQKLFTKMRKLECCKYIPTYFGISLLMTNLYSNYTRLSNLQVLDHQLNAKLDLARTNHINYLNKMEAASFGMMLTEMKHRNYTYNSHNAHGDNAHGDNAHGDNSHGDNSHGEKDMKNIKRDPFQLYNSYAAFECSMNRNSERIVKDNDLENQLEFQQYHTLLKGMENLEYYKQNCQDQCFLSLVVLAGYGTIQGLCYFLKDQETDENSVSTDVNDSSCNSNSECNCDCITKLTMENSKYSNDFAATESDEENDLDMDHCLNKDMEAGFA